MNENKFDSEVLNDLVNLQKFAVNHFNSEEHYFEIYNYPKNEEHTNQHNYFKGRISELIESYKQNDFDVLKKTSDYMKDWMLKHVLGSDKEYEIFFAGKDLE